MWWWWLWGRGLSKGNDEDYEEVIEGVCYDWGEVLAWRFDDIVNDFVSSDFYIGLAVLFLLNNDAILTSPTFPNFPFSNTLS